MKRTAPIKPLIVEVDRAAKLPELTSDLREGIISLQHVPAFQYLVQKARIQKSLLRAQLEEGLDMPEVSLRCLQAGIFWISFLDRELTGAGKVLATRAPQEPELAEFNKITSQLDLIGLE